MIKPLLKQILPKSIVDRFRHLVWQELSPSWHLSSGLTLQVRDSAEWVIYNDIFVDGEYDLAIQLLLEEVNDSVPLIIDIGANVGFFVLRFADQWIKTKGRDHPFKLIGVEGTPTTYKELTKRMSSVGLDLINESCDFHLGLIGQKSGFRYITESSFHGTNSLTSGSSFRAQKVPFIDLEAIIPTENISLLKCDIEGGEEQFIRNNISFLHRVEIAVFELHHNLCDTKICIDLLKKVGLSERKILRKFDDCSVELFTRKQDSKKLS